MKDISRLWLKLMAVCPGNQNHFRIFSLSRLVTEKILTFEPVFFQEEKPFEYHVEEGVFMEGNPGDVGQLVSALIDNAVKYSVPKGRTEIRLEHGGRNKARLWVNSQGEPIPEDRRKSIFKGFYREEKTGDGPRGCGLAMAARTARSHRAVIGMDYRDSMNCFWVVVRKGKPPL